MRKFVKIDSYYIPVENIICGFSMKAYPRPIQNLIKEKKKDEQTANMKSLYSTNTVLLLQDGQILQVELSFNTTLKRLDAINSDFVAVDKGCFVRHDKIALIEKYDKKELTAAVKNKLSYIKLSGRFAPACIIFLSTDLAIGVKHLPSYVLNLIMQKQQEEEKKGNKCLTEE